MKHHKMHDVLKVSRSSLYYKKKKPAEDWKIKQKLKKYCTIFPAMDTKEFL